MERKLAAILAADVVGYTRHVMQRLTDQPGHEHHSTIGNLRKVAGALE